MADLDTLDRPADVAPTPSAAEKRRVPDSKLLIGGRWRDAADGATKPSINPADESEIAQVAQATPDDVEQAIAAARQAFDEGPWPRMAGRERQQVLARAARLIEEAADELAYLETVDVGKPIAFSSAIDSPMCARLYDYYAGIAGIWTDDGAARMVQALPDASAKLAAVIREPLGVVAAITPFNFPLLSATTKIAPALAAGNCVIHKPASATPLSAARMAQILVEAGVPEGVFTLLTGPGGKVGDALVKSPLVDKISLTGSTEVGINMVRDSAETLKHVTMELGGKSANLIFADADMDAAVENAFFAIFYNKGEICTAGSRLLVERAVHDEFVERLVARVRQTKIGDPLDPATTFGPQADQGQLDKIEHYVAAAREDGGRIAIGGERSRPEGFAGKGFWFQPTIVTGVEPDHRIAQEEIFGPVLAVIPFEDEGDAIRIANSSPFGLASAVHTRDLGRAWRVARAMKAGTCWINCYNVYDPAVPFGGYKASGYGRECGPEVMENYTQAKSVWFNLG